MTVLHEHASVAQWTAHRLSTPMVAGSNPVGGTEFDTDKLRKIHRLWESLVNPPGWGQEIACSNRASPTASSHLTVP